MNIINTTDSELTNYLVKDFNSSNKEPTERNIAQFSEETWLKSPLFRQYFGEWEDIQYRLMNHFKIFYG